MDTTAAQALIRFGLGRRGAEPLPADPRLWLRSQLDGPDPALSRPAPSTADGLRAIVQTTANMRAARMNGAAPDRTALRRVIAEGIADATDGLLTATLPFRERLVWFWANHFTISRRQGNTAPLCNAYVREAIRPHVTGRFTDMLSAVMHHPAMLMYLDNAQSIGPHSRAGLRLHRGLNENLARECLELHTVTPASGYTQADVTAFAAVLTGWSVNYRADPPGFMFRPFAHEPGEQTVMGKRWPAGYAGGTRMLTWLGTHPATMHNLAVKLARHFVADDPAPAAIAHIESVLNDTGGDLKAASLAMLGLDQAWAPLTKLRTPFDYVAAVLRAVDLPAAHRPNVAGSMGQLGQPFMLAPLPNGWSDRATDWAAPGMLMRRIDWASAIAWRAREQDPEMLAQATLGKLLPADAMRQIARAGSRHEALAMLIAAPQFQRR